MRVETLGDGTAEVAVVGGIHGDEPCGVRAVEGVIEESPAVERPVKLVVANEEALERGVRYIDADLNRAFPGDPDAGPHEYRLAARLTDELRGCTVLALHSTQSHPEPFAIVSGVDEFARDVVPRLPVVAAVDTGSFVDGRIFAAARSVEVECGRQGTDRAAENAAGVVRAFLAATGVLGEPAPAREVPLFRLSDAVPKPDAEEYAVHPENFERVDAGEVFASAGGDPLRAAEPFYPVLMSAEGYDEVFGYAAERVGTI
ncbi:MAG: succinylglutamate desuccinylase/aspartoacylase family protein [Halobacteriaceae archaeon]